VHCKILDSSSGSTEHSFDTHTYIHNQFQPTPHNNFEIFLAALMTFVPFILVLQSLPSRGMDRPVCHVSTAFLGIVQVALLFVRGLVCRETFFGTRVFSLPSSDCLLRDVSCCSISRVALKEEEKKRHCNDSSRLENAVGIVSLATNEWRH
jgi:hypothetical protein